MATQAPPEPAPGSAVCVTGATGFIGSALVWSLLERGYVVHAAARDTGKAWQMLSPLSLATGNHRLKVFRADLREEGSFDEAVEGCVGVFHVAASMEFTTSTTTTENIEEYVQSKILEPAIKGTMNLLEACCRAGTIKRVVFTSSISTITGRDSQGGWRTVVDELSSVPLDSVWKMKPNGWVYVLSKLMTEEKAFKFAGEKGIDLVSIIPPTVAGSFFTPTVPSSHQVFFSPLTGDPQFYSILAAVNSRLGSIPLVHIQDICKAHIFLMEENSAKGRYICTACSCTLPQLTRLLSSELTSFTSWRFSEEIDESAIPKISSKKLTDLGFEFEFSIQDIVKESVSCCTEHGFLKQLSLETRDN